MYVNCSLIKNIDTVKYLEVFGDFSPLEKFMSMPQRISRTKLFVFFLYILKGICSGHVLRKLYFYIEQVRFICGGGGNTTHLYLSIIS